MQRSALVIRTYGDQELAKSMAAAMESPELKKLRAQVGVHTPVRRAYYQKKILEAKKKYTTKPASPFAQKFWGTIGLIMVLMGAA